MIDGKLPITTKKGKDEAVICQPQILHDAVVLGSWLVFLYLCEETRLSRRSSSHGAPTCDYIG